MQKPRTFVKQAAWMAAGSVIIPHFNIDRSKASLEDEVLGTGNLNIQSLP